MISSTVRIVRELSEGRFDSISGAARFFDMPRSWFYKVYGGELEAKIGTLESMASRTRETIEVVPVPMTVGLFAPEAIAKLDDLWVSPSLCILEARKRMPDYIEADCSAEKLDISFSKISTLIDGTTVAGDPLDIYRAKQIVGQAKSALSDKHDEPLRILTRNGVIVAGNGESPMRELDFLSRAIQAGADPVLTRYLVNAKLLKHGYPWLSPTYSKTEEYRKALYVCQGLGDGEPLMRCLVESATHIRSQSQSEWWWKHD